MSLAIRWGPWPDSLPGVVMSIKDYTTIEGFANCEGLALLLFLTFCEAGGPGMQFLPDSWGLGALEL